MQSAIDTINMVGENQTVADAYTTFAVALAAEQDKRKLVVSRDKWNEFIKPYLDLDAGGNYTDAMTAYVLLLLHYKKRHIRVDSSWWRVHDDATSPLCAGRLALLCWAAPIGRVSV